MKLNIERLRVLTLREIAGTLDEEEKRELDKVLGRSDEALKIWSQIHDDMEHGRRIQPSTLKKHISWPFPWLISLLAGRSPVKWAVLGAFIALKGWVFFKIGQYEARHRSPAKTEQHAPVVVAGRGTAAV